MHTVLPTSPPPGEGVLPELSHRSVADASNVATRCDSQNGSTGGDATVILKHSGGWAGPWDSARNNQLDSGRGRHLGSCVNLTLIVGILA